MIAGLILAAGEGARYGAEPKLLAELEGRPLLEWAIEAQCGVPAIERVVVVLGSGADAVLERVDFMRAEPVVCDDWREGQSASLRCGVEALAGADRIIVTLGDEPLITPAAIDWLAGQQAPARALYDGRPGHPVLLGREQLAAIAGLSGDHGARELLVDALTIECGHLCSGHDVDTPNDLEAIRSEARAVI